MNVGLSIKTQEEQEASLSFSMSYGIEFEDAFGASTTLEESTRSLIAQDVENSYAFAFSSQTEIYCTAEDSDGVGLWQWVVDKGDRKSVV